MITASELGKLAARVKMAADPTFRKSDTVMPSVAGSSAPKPSVAPYAPNPKSGPGGGKENWDYAPKKPNAVSRAKERRVLDTVHAGTHAD